MSPMRFETLEKRQMFAASSLSDAAEAYVLMNCPNDFMARPEEVIPTEAVASVAAGADRVDALFADGSTHGLLLPYLEQENLHKAQAGDRPQEICAVAWVARVNPDSSGNLAHSTSLTSLASITDGTSNTIFLRKDSGDDAAGSRLGVDVWEHAFSTRTGPHHDGIIAILIGLVADPSDPSDSTANGINGVFCDGSVHFIVPEAIAMSLVDFGADATAALTHDAAFEDWAHVMRFDRGYLPPA